MGFNVRCLESCDMDAAAVTMRASFDDRLPWLAGRHTPDEDRAFFRDRLLPTHELWGAFEGSKMVGVLAFRDGWIDQLYIRPGHQGCGIGAALIGVAKQASSELRLRTFKANTGARRFYEHRGFVVVDETDGSGNEEREPDLLYRWRAGEERDGEP